MGEANDAPVSSSLGEYVNIGACWLVSLAVPSSTAPFELDDVIESLLLEATIVLLSTGVAFGLAVIEAVSAVLELSSVVGAGVGVM